MNFCPSREHNVSIESFLRTARHQISAVSERSGMVDQSEKSRVKTTLAWRRPSKNSVPHFIQFSASSRTIRPAWSYNAAYWPLTPGLKRKISVGLQIEEMSIVRDVAVKS